MTLTLSEIRELISEMNPFVALSLTQKNNLIFTVYEKNWFQLVTQLQITVAVELS